jgi:L-histidine Nalpha-methyltransferase
MDNMILDKPAERSAEFTDSWYPTASAQLPSVADEAHRGLLLPQKELRPWLLYDELGSLLFQRITDLPEYGVTRTEAAILSTYVNEILAKAGDGLPLLLVELGSGQAQKTGVLLRGLAELQDELTYVPIDIAASSLLLASEWIKRELPRVLVRPQIADYTHGLLSLKRTHSERILLLFFGSTIGNSSPKEAVHLLKQLTAQLLPGDRMLIGIDLIKSPRELIAAYNDASGVTAAFNLNLLVRLKRELGASFDPALFRHEATWNTTESRIEMHLMAREEHWVTFPAMGARSKYRVHFGANETIHTESSYKYSVPGFLALLKESKLLATDSWTDTAARFCLAMATVA